VMSSISTSSGGCKTSNSPSGTCPDEIRASVVLPLRYTHESQRCKVYLPRRYCGLITDVEIFSINDRHIVLHLVYKGTWKASSQHQFTLVHDNSM
jgi:hypothetical protein